MDTTALRLRCLLDEDPKVAHVHLKVADLDHALAFHCGVLGFELMQRYGMKAAFVSAGAHHFKLLASNSRGDSAESKEAVLKVAAVKAA